MNTGYNQIVDTSRIASLNSRGDIAGLIALGEKENLPPASEDKTKRLLLAIDVQNDFMEGIGSLPVRGSKGDVERLTGWIYRNSARLTQIVCSLDTHSIAQIFHPAWWKDADGNQPQPFTTITADDLLTGKWDTALAENRERTLSYLQNLEANNSLRLCVWPYHCLKGTYGAELEGEFARMLYFHSAARRSSPVLIAKGQDPFSEMYGIIKAEYAPEGYTNTAVLDMIAQSDEVYIAGEASSHCVLSSAVQILRHFGDRKDITNRITVLEDCMSPIAGFEEATRKAFEGLKQEYGIKVAQSAEIIL